MIENPFSTYQQFITTKTNKVTSKERKEDPSYVYQSSGRRLCDIIKFAENIYIQSSSGRNLLMMMMKTTKKNCETRIFVNI